MGFESKTPKRSTPPSPSPSPSESSSAGSDNDDDRTRAANEKRDRIKSRRKHQQEQEQEQHPRKLPNSGMKSHALVTSPTTATATATSATRIENHNKQGKVESKKATTLLPEGVEEEDGRTLLSSNSKDEGLKSPLKSSLGTSAPSCHFLLAGSNIYHCQSHGAPVVPSNLPGSNAGPACSPSSLKPQQPSHEPRSAGRQTASRQQARLTKEAFEAHSRENREGKQANTTSPLSADPLFARAPAPATATVAADSGNITHVHRARGEKRGDKKSQQRARNHPVNAAMLPRGLRILAKSTAANSDFNSATSTNTIISTPNLNPANSSQQQTNSKLIVAKQTSSSSVLSNLLKPSSVPSTSIHDKQLNQQQPSISPTATNLNENNHNNNTYFTNSLHPTSSRSIAQHYPQHPLNKTKLSKSPSTAYKTTTTTTNYTSSRNLNLNSTNTPNIMADQAVVDKLEAGFAKLQAATPEQCHSLLKKYLTREVLDKLKTKKTAMNATLLDVVQSGFENLDSGVGIYAPDAESYTLFADLFNSIIEDYHGGFKPTDKHPQSDFGDLETLVNVDPNNEFVISTRVRCGRSLKGYPFNPCLTEAQYKEMEQKVSSTLKEMEGDHAGTYYPLTGMTKETQQQLIDDHFLFKEGDRFLQAANACRYWPTGRGIYHNAAKTFLVWVNEEDHLRIISMQKGGDLKAVFGRLVKGAKAIEAKVPFSRDDRLGFLTFCPTNLGTTIRASVHIKLPKLAADRKKLEEVAGRYNLQVRGTSGEHTESVGGVYDISNKRRLGLTEYQAVREMQDGILELIKIEKSL